MPALLSFSHPALLPLQAAVGYQAIRAREAAITDTVQGRWQALPNLSILGSAQAARLPIISFMIHEPQSGRFLHWSFVTALLNDLFGVQCRGG